jgi:hypothetical protein
MYRLVTVHIAPGKRDDYWAWAQEIIALWRAHNVPVTGIWAARDEDGSDVGFWLTEHASEAEEQELFRAMYSTAEGARLIALRPPLVARTEVHRLEDVYVPR